MYRGGVPSGTKGSRSARTGAVGRSGKTARTRRARVDRRVFRERSAVMKSPSGGWRERRHSMARRRMRAMVRYRMVLAKEDFKFSSAHFTLFADGSAELLHGHNYR